MHGQIGKPNQGVRVRGDLGFYYRNRAVMFDAFRRLGNGTIDYDFYRARARAERHRALQDTSRPLLDVFKPLLAVVAIGVAIWLMPTTAQDCGSCAPHAAVTTGIAAK
jgi:hypothetical protein